MRRVLVDAAAGFLVGVAALGAPQTASAAACADPLPIDPAVVAKELGARKIITGRRAARR
jgi:hypothetical protein